MGKRNECYLCGARLQNGYCHDCGLDNKKIRRKNYRLNESNAISSINGKVISKRKSNVSDISPRAVEVPVLNQNTKSIQRKASDTHSEAKISVKKPVINIQTPKQKVQKYQFVNSARKPRKRIPIKIVATLIIVIVFLAQFIGNIYDEFRYEDAYTTFYEEPYIDYEEPTEYDPYEFVTRELSESGEAWGISLEAGEYIVGTHLPEGNYTVNIAAGSGTFSVNDDENGIYLWESFAENDEYGDIQTMEDVRLYQNAKVSISEDVMLAFYTENAQTSNMRYIENPLTEEIYVKGGTTLIAGIDFPAGVYDAVCAEESAWATYMIPANPEWYEEGYVNYSFWMDVYGASEFYRNIVLPEGAEIFAEDYDLQLIPSSIISPMDYHQYYDYYMYNAEQNL